MSSNYNKDLGNKGFRKSKNVGPRSDVSRPMDYVPLFSLYYWTYVLLICHYVFLAREKTLNEFCTVLEEIGVSPTAMASASI